MKALRESESSNQSQAATAGDESRESHIAAASEAPASRPGRVEFGRYIGWVVGATLLVAVLPTAAVWWLRTDGVIRSPLLTLVVALVATLAASRLGTAYWEKRTSPGDLLFGELLLWGFIRRCISERRLSSARAVLGSLAEAHARLDGSQSTGLQAEALQKLSAALEATDPYTHGHSRRVARHCWMIAKRMGLDSDTVARVRTAAALHDVGKVYTPASVLRKPGKLTDEEFDVIKRHPVDGAEMVKALGDEELVSIVRHHHERLDGTGYPDRLVAGEIPIGARIISVADTFDAITSARPYRPARAHKKALDILKYEAGTQLDPSVVKAFCAIYSGRRPLALWASFTSLPSQVFSWLGAGAASAASAAQVAAVAAAAAVGASAAVAHRSPSRDHRGHPGIAEVHTQGTPAGSYAYLASARSTLHGGSSHKPAAASGGITTGGSPGSAPGSQQGPASTVPDATAPQVTQTNSSAAAAEGGGVDGATSHEGTQKTSDSSGSGDQTSSGSSGETSASGAPKAPTSPKEGSGTKEGSGSKEGKKSKEEEKAREEKKAKEEEEKKAREEKKKAKEEEKATKEEERKLKEEEKRKAKEEEQKAKEEKKAKEAKEAAERKAAAEEQKAKERKTGGIGSVLEIVVGD